jgi:hypothetical protein
MDTDDAMGLALESDQRAKLNTDRVKQYLRLLAAEHIDGGYEDDETDYSEERDTIWDTMTKAEQKTTNDLVRGVFGEWL